MRWKSLDHPWKDEHTFQVTLTGKEILLRYNVAPATIVFEKIGDQINRLRLPATKPGWLFKRRKWNR